MSTRLLFVLSLLVAIFAAWFYRHQGEFNPPVSLAESNIEYQGTDILALQTNDKGMAEYALIADDLTHYADQNIDKLTAMTLNWRPNQQKNVTITADEALMYHETSKVIMSNNVILASQDETVAPSSTASDSVNLSSRPPLRLESSQLTGDLEDKRIYSETPVVVTQGDNKFESASFSANMVNGEYEFEQVAVTFMPPERQDVPLF